MTRAGRGFSGRCRRRIVRCFLKNEKRPYISVRTGNNLVVPPCFTERSRVLPYQRANTRILCNGSSRRTLGRPHVRCSETMFARLTPIPFQLPGFSVEASNGVLFSSSPFCGDMNLMVCMITPIYPPVKRGNRTKFFLASVLSRAILSCVGADALGGPLEFAKNR